jgi:hypothetical protein
MSSHFRNLSRELVTRLRPSLFSFGSAGKCVLDPLSNETFFGVPVTASREVDGVNAGSRASGSAGSEFVLLPVVNVVIEFLLLVRPRTLDELLFPLILRIREGTKSGFSETGDSDVKIINASYQLLCRVCKNKKLT